MSDSLGQVAAKMHSTRFPVLNRTVTLFPKSSRQQKRAVPVVSLICLNTPRFPMDRLHSS